MPNSTPSLSRAAIHRMQHVRPCLSCPMLPSQVICSHNRQIIGFDGPFWGVENDGVILRRAMQAGKYPMQPWELLLADGAYK